MSEEEKNEFFRQMKAMSEQNSAAFSRFAETVRGAAIAASDGMMAASLAAAKARRQRTGLQKSEKSARNSSVGGVGRASFSQKKEASARMGFEYYDAISEAQRAKARARAKASAARKANRKRRKG